jgi:hypothetical protein
MKLKGHVLASVGTATGVILMGRVCGLIGRLGTLISSRSICSLVLQLGAGICWTFTTINDIGQSRQSRDPSTLGKKDDPVHRRYLAIKSTEPNLVCRRTLDAWSEGALLACADEGWLTLPIRVGNQKQPKPTNAGELRKITWKQLLFVAKKYKSMEKLRAALRPSGDPAADKIFKTLMRAINAVQSEQQIPDECLPLLEKLRELADAIVAGHGPSPKWIAQKTNGIAKGFSQTAKADSPESTGSECLPSHFTARNKAAGKPNKQE